MKFIKCEDAKLNNKMQKEEYNCS